MEYRLPEYVVHDDAKILGFFGPYRFLSNFQLCPVGIWWMGRKFPSTENAYQAAKFPVKYHDLFVNVSPAESKKINRTLTKKFEEEGSDEFDSTRWELIRFSVMSDLVFQKFNFDIGLRQKLLNTGNRFLEETNSWKDKYWGRDIVLGGENKLGILHMKMRDFFTEKEYPNVNNVNVNPFIS